MTLIDTSSWIEALRHDGDPSVRSRVVALLLAGEAAWCDFVRLELWNGLRGVAERRQMEALEIDVTNLATTDQVWHRACALARGARAAGLTAPGADVLIAACAMTHGVLLEHGDAHLTALLQLSI